MTSVEGTSMWPRDKRGFGVLLTAVATGKVEEPSGMANKLGFGALDTQTCRHPV